MTQILIRGGAAAEWAAANPVLGLRELGVETDTYVVKVGDGATHWSSLPATASPALAALAASAVQPARAVATGTGLTGGGTLAANLTISLSAASIASLALADSALQPAALVALDGGTP